MALMQDVVRELRSERGRRGDGDKQLSRIHGKGTIEILRCNSHDCGGLPIQAKCLSPGIGGRIKAIAPEGIADYHNRRVARPVKCGVEHSSTLGLDTQYRKIID